MNLNLVNDPNSALDVSDLAGFRAQFSGSVAETATNIHILHNHNFWWAMSINFISPKATPHMAM
jgi:hypothetical protein